jgi:hypothetical protein
MGNRLRDGCPDPAARRVRRDVTAHAYDQLKDEFAHPVTQTYRVSDEPWTGFTARGIRCARCTELMSRADGDEALADPH